MDLRKATDEAMRRITLPMIASRAKISTALLRQSRLGQDHHGHRQGRPSQVHEALITLCEEQAAHFATLAKTLRRTQP